MTNRRTRSRPSRWRCAAAAAAVAALSAGCAAPGASLESSPDVALRSVEVPLYNPVWSYRRQTLVASTDDHRLAEVSALDQAGTHTRLSEALETGRNLQISQKNTGLVLVPQPRNGCVAVVDLASLRVVEHFQAGPAPAYLSEDAGQRILLALSADGRSVTPVEQYGWRALPTAAISGDPVDSVDGANRGRAIDYHLYGPSGIRYYNGQSWPAPERGSLTMDVAVSAGDGTKATRSYVASEGQDVLYAVDSRRGGEGMEVVGHAVLPSSPIRFLGTDDTRVYAATDHDVVVLEAASVIGYPRGTIPILRVIDYRSALPAGPARSAEVSGMAIGPHRVYLPLAGLPYLVSVAKPRV